MARARSTATGIARLRPRVKVWLELGDDYAFGHGLCEILKGVAAAGSIKEASARLGKNYRYVWGRIKEAEQTLGETLVETQVGGKDDHRSTLTPLADRLVMAYDQLRDSMLRTVDKEFARTFPPARG